MRGNLYVCLYNQIAKIYSLLEKNNFLNIEFTKFHPEVRGNGVIKLSIGINFLQLESEDYSVEEYFELLKKGKGIVLLDGTILQMYYEIDIGIEKITKHSLILYPPPFVSFSSLDPDDSLLLLLEINEKSDRICEASGIIASTIEINKILYPRTFPLRFDYDKSNDETQHPASHCHLIHPENRIPLNQPLTPKKFFKIALQLTNPSIWNHIRKELEKIKDIDEKYITSHHLDYDHPLRFEIL